MRRFLIAACAVLAPCLALAQSIYKVQMPDGSIMFTDTPPADSKVLEERSAKSARAAAAAPTASSRTSPATTAPIVRTGPPPGAQSAVDVAANAVNTAERELAVAKRALDLGREPLPGERLGLKGGGTRLSPEYDTRIRGLEQSVADAEAKLKRAYDSRNAAR